MLRNTFSFGVAVVAALAIHPAYAQSQKGGWFMPPQHAAAPATPPHAAAHPHAAPRSPAQPEPSVAPLANDAAPAPDESAAQIPLPPVPDLPALPKVAPPPAAVIGVLGVPEVMRASVAAQAVESVIRERREKLNQEAQKELSAERDRAQALAKLPPDQQRVKEKQLRDDAAEAQRVFRERAQVIQQAAQYALSQIERTLIAVIRQVAESHGMNLVVHRAQVALNINDFDITSPVTEQLNKILPSVKVPPEGVTVADFVKQQGKQAPAGIAPTAEPQHPQSTPNKH